MTDSKALDGEIILPGRNAPVWRTPTREVAEDLAARITAAHAELSAGLRTTVERAADLGVLLLDAKAKFRGEWLFWLERNTPIQRRMANIYMELAKERSATDRRKWKRISTLGINAALAEFRSIRRREPQPVKNTMAGPRIVGWTSSTPEPEPTRSNARPAPLPPAPPSPRAPLPVPAAPVSATPAPALAPEQREVVFGLLDVLQEYAREDSGFGVDEALGALDRLASMLHDTGARLLRPKELRS